MKNSLAIFLILILAFIITPKNSDANNVSVSNVSVTGQNTNLDYSYIQFNLSWSNSWRNDINGSGKAAPYNYDAVWIFVKFKKAVGDWTHAKLQPGTTTTPTGYDVTIPSDGVGAFIYRDANGTGDNTFSNVQVRWNYGNEVTDFESVSIQVFAIEMVYIPQGAFSLGSGGNKTSEFYKYPTTTSTFSVANENVIYVGETNDYLYYNSSTNGGDRSGPIPAAFPKGCEAFYCMKYEITQQQYVDFLNSLTQTQATNRKYTGSSARYAITGSAVGSYATTNLFVACNYLSWNDLAAYLDWAGLRPMTELEYEKSCRGTLTPVANEYSWGSTSITQCTGISNPGANNEVSSNSSANCNYGQGGTAGPLRVGVFATSENSREKSGATYYGIMEMTGNLWERVISIGNSTGRSYTGIHGDGSLDSNGNANVTNWPGADAIGGGLRGGGVLSPTAEGLILSSRIYGAYVNSDNNNVGGRGVRKAN